MKVIEHKIILLVILTLSSIACGDTLIENTDDADTAKSQEESQSLKTVTTEIEEITEVVESVIYLKYLKMGLKIYFRGN